MLKFFKITKFFYRSLKKNWFFVIYSDEYIVLFSNIKQYGYLRKRTDIDRKFFSKKSWHKKMSIKVKI